jgi:Protein of unknown function (DUF2511)
MSSALRITMVVLAILAVATLTGCGSGSGGSSSAGTSAANGVNLSKSDFGPAWPLTVDQATVRCENGNAVVLDANGTTYAVNGAAKTETDYPDVQAIWRDNPALPGTKVDIGPVIDAGLKLC